MRLQAKMGPLQMVDGGLLVRHAWVEFMMVHCQGSDCNMVRGGGRNRCISTQRGPIVGATCWVGTPKKVVEIRCRSLERLTVQAPGGLLRAFPTLELPRKIVRLGDVASRVGGTLR